jgi:hypothetical protein
MIEQCPQRLCKGRNRALIRSDRIAVAAAREIGNDDSKTPFQCACLKFPVSATRSQSMNQQQIRTVPTYAVVQGTSLMIEFSQLYTLCGDGPCR